MPALQLPGHEIGDPTERGDGESLIKAVLRTIQFAGKTVEVAEIGVGSARAAIPRMMRDSALTGRAYFIRNNKNPTAASALLVSPQALEKLLYAPVERRTLGAVLDALPFRGVEVPRIRKDHPDNIMRTRRVPSMEEPSGFDSASDS
jgi:hypothetical protein